MANIDKELRDIKHAIYGKQVRPAIESGLRKVNRESESSREIAKKTSTKQEKLQKQFDDQIKNLESDNPSFEELVQARGNEPLLKDRLDKSDQELEKTNNEQQNIKNAINYELNSKGRKKQGLVVFISDDGHVGDLKYLKPLFESEKVPFCFAVVSDWMDSSHSMNGTRASWEQMRYLQNEMGCEALSHSHSHNRPTAMPDMTESQLRKDYKDSIKIIKENGLEVQSFRVPGNQYTTRERNICREYFRSMVVSDYGFDGLNKSPYETFELKSIWLDNESFGGAKEFSYYKRHIDKAAQTDSLLIISTHGYALDGVMPLFKRVVQYAKNVSEITTLKDALNRTGNLIEVGDFTKTFNSRDRLNRVPNEFQHFAVGSDGTASGTATVTDKNRFTPKSEFKEFPYGVTVTPVYQSHASGAPYDKSGLLINYRVDDAEVGFNRQEYIPYSEPWTTFRRDVLADWTFSDDWLPKEGITHPQFNDYDHTTPFSEFPEGITFSVVGLNNDNILSAPKQTNGILATYKFAGANFGYNYQEYHLFKSSEVFRRNPLSDSDFGDWDSVGGISLPNSNTHNIDTPLYSFALGVTYSAVTSSNSSINNAPEKSPGVLITHRLTNSSLYAMSFQEYHLNYNAGLPIYKRRAVGWDEWGEWVKLK